MIKEGAISVAFSQSGDTIVWQRGDYTYQIQYSTTTIAEFTVRRGHWNSTWPVNCLPPRYRTFYSQLDQIYWYKYSEHPTFECGSRCPVCTGREADHQVFLYLLCIATKIRYIHSLRKK